MVPSRGPCLVKSRVGALREERLGLSLHGGCHALARGSRVATRPFAPSLVQAGRAGGPGWEALLSEEEQGLPPHGKQSGSFSMKGCCTGGLS